MPETYLAFTYKQRLASTDLAKINPKTVFLCGLRDSA